MKLIKKKKSYAFGKDIYLLGKDKFGQYRWLEKHSWECGWYWGFGYIESYTNNRNPRLSKDITEHTHFDYLFFRGEKTHTDAFEDLFEECTLTKDEIWKVCELFSTAYKLKDAAGLFSMGSSGITDNALSSKLKNKEFAEKTNGMLNEVLNEVLKILDPEVKGE